MQASGFHLKRSPSRVECKASVRRVGHERASAIGCVTCVDGRHPRPAPTGPARQPGRRRAAPDADPRQFADARTRQRRPGRREADRGGGQHLDQPDPQGARGRAASQGAQGRAVRGVLRGLLQAQGRLPVRPQGLLARLRLRHRRQGRLHRHQQPRDRRRRRDHRQLPRRHQAEGRQGDRQGHQDRSGAAQGHPEKAAGRPYRSAVPPSSRWATG